jgi:hypothetical protein
VVFTDGGFRTQSVTAGVFTEREGPAGSGSLTVERVVDRLAGASCACCAFRAFGRAFSAASALRAGRLRNGKEKVYGSIP